MNTRALLLLSTFTLACSRPAVDVGSLESGDGEAGDAESSLPPSAETYPGGTGEDSDASAESWSESEVSTSAGPDTGSSGEPSCTPIDEAFYSFTGSLVPEDCSAPVTFSGQLRNVDSTRFEVWDCECGTPCTEGEPQQFEIEGLDLEIYDDSCVVITATRSDCEDQLVHMIDFSGDSPYGCDLILHYSKIRSVHDYGAEVGPELPLIHWEPVDGGSICTNEDDDVVYVNDIDMALQGGWANISEGEAHEFYCPTPEGEDEQFAQVAYVKNSRETALTPWAFEPFVEVFVKSVILYP